MRFNYYLLTIFLYNQIRKQQVTKPYNNRPNWLFMVKLARISLYCNIQHNNSTQHKINNLKEHGDSKLFTSYRNELETTGK